ncbi:MAG: hypothetical protein ABI995_09345 [Acidobacteriota bacterium]
MFQPHQNLSDAINRNIIQSEIEGGVDLRALPRMSTLEVATRNHRYVLVMEHDSDAWIAGHPEFCPEPVLVHISGSNWGGSMIKMNYLGRGMHMEFRHPGYPGSIVTSPIVDIRVLSEAA